MNELDRSQFEWLKRRQAQLEEELRLLGKQLERLETRLSQAAPESVKAPEPAKQASVAPVQAPPTTASPAPEIRPPTPKAPAAPPSAAPPIISPAPVFAQSVSQPTTPQRSVPTVAQAARQTVVPPTIPQQTVIHQQAGVGGAGSVVGTPSPVAAQSGAGARPPLAPRSESGTPPPLESKPERSFEMRLGTYWLVRIGIVMLVTGLVFFGNYAYQNYIGKIGPGGKLTLLYLASGILLGAGAWWQRKAVKESLKNYAQVLFAGGLATVYFTTYAAHHLEPVKVIKDPILDGTLLLGWAAFMVWIADRKKSEVLALFAVLLAYYSSVITHVGLFTLYSNLVLTCAAVFFLVRNRWATLSFVSLAATYAAYGFWRFFNGSEWHWASPDEGLWTGTYFLIAYWVIFTAAVFLSRHEKLAKENRASFLTLNNGAFFAMFLLTMLQVRQGGFWKFALIYGTVLLALAGAAWGVLKNEPLARNSYLTQGLLLITLGFITKYSGLNLALILATESAVLLFSGQLTRNRVMLVGAYVSALLSVFWGMDGIRQQEPHGLWLAVGLGFLMMVNTVVTHYYLTRATEGAGTSPVVSPSLPLRPQPSYFTTLALAIWLVAAWNNTARQNFPVVLAVEATLLILSIYVLRIREISALSQLYLGVAQVVWTFDAFEGALSMPWWNPVLMLVLGIGLWHWWGQQKLWNLSATSDPFWRAAVKLPLLGKNLVLLAGTYVIARLAGEWDLNARVQSDALGLYLPMGLGALILADTLLHDRKAPSTPPARLRPQVTYSTALALLAFLAVTWNRTTPELFPLTLAFEALLLTFSIYLLRVPEITLLGQGYLIVAQLFWISHFGLETRVLPPWWNPVLLIAISLGLSHWWQKQKTLELRRELGGLWQGYYALAIVGLLFFWLSTKVGAQGWLALSSVLAVAMTAYGVLTRAWLLAAFGQVFVLVTGYEFVAQLMDDKPAWYFALVPLAVLGLLSWSTMRWFQARPDANKQVREPLLQFALIYRWAALAMSVWWVCKYIPERECVWVFALLGFLVFLLSGWRKSSEALLFGGVFTVAALVVFWLPKHADSTVYLPNLLAIAAILAQQQIAKRLPERYHLDANVHGAVIIAGGLSLWLFVSRWVLELAGPGGHQGGYLTASWSILAFILFSCGIILRERIYRWLGLTILACALGRVIIFDVWKLETIYRILSFMALGVVLLVLGFIYNKYQEKIKEWL